MTTFLIVLLLSISFVSSAQLANLLQNPNADQAAAAWRVFGNATIEATNGNSHFVVRDGGYFFQDVALPDDAAGQYAVLQGYGSSERINPDGAITGLPALYGYMMPERARDGDKVLDYLQGQAMLARTRTPDQWVGMWGIFKVPQGTKRLRFFLNQALANGTPHNGSAARFDDLGLYLFPTKEAAETFVNGLK